MYSCDRDTYLLLFFNAFIQSSRMILQNELFTFVGDFLFPINEHCLMCNYFF